MSGRVVDEMSASAAPLTLGAAIRARRQELGWSQEELAERVAEHGDQTFRQSDVSRLERGKVGLPRRERLEHLAATLDLPLGDLLARSGWTGAAAAFVPRREENRAAPGGDGDGWAANASRASHRSWSNDREATTSKLGSLIEQALETQGRAQDLLRRCEATRRRYQETKLLRAPAPSASAAGDAGEPSAAERN